MVEGNENHLGRSDIGTNTQARASTLRVAKGPRETAQERKARILAQRMAALEEYAGDDEVVSSIELAAYYEGQKEPEVRFTSGIPSLDAYCDGFQLGELVVVSGKTKSGKTLLCQTITRHLALKQMENPLWFSYEVPPRQFLTQFGKTPPLFYLPKQLHARSYEWFEDRCLESWEKNSTRVIFVDHLHFLFDMFSVRNPSLEIGGFVRKIKRFAVDFGFLVFLCAHITKVAAGERPTVENLRDSSFVSQEADVVLMQWRVREEKTKQIHNDAMLSVEVSRRSGVMEKMFPIRKIGGFLVEVMPGQQEEKGDWWQK